MSGMESWIGTAEVIKPKDGEDLEALCKRMCNERGINDLEYSETWQECIQDRFYKMYIIASESLYDVSDKKDVQDEDIFEASLNNDGTVRFTLQFYNGGCSFSEAFEHALKRSVK